MGDHPQAHLAYGYHLGGPDYGTHIEGETPDWFYGYPQDYLEGVYRAAGKPHDGVLVISHGVWEDKGYVLAASESVGLADEGGAIVFDDGIPEVRAAWDRALAEALELLGITPTQSYPLWVLTSYYG